MAHDRAPAGKACAREESRRASGRARVGEKACASICSPSEFFCEEFARRVAANRAHERQRWIFDLIAGARAEKEQVFLDREEWMLVLGSAHVATDTRYLVVFKDLGLHTIRDLRRAHVKLLQAVGTEVRAFLQRQDAQTAGGFRLYFHYLPSVFQLHLHVCSDAAAADSARVQLLRDVVRNLKEKDTWYRDALILFAAPRARAAASAVRRVPTPGADKQGGAGI